MRISGHSTSIISRLRPASTPRATTPSGGRGADTLALSPTGQLFMKAEQSLRELPAVREARVRELRALVGTGTYRVNADSVAAAMLEGQEAGGHE